MSSIKILINDITQLDVDCIVNAANEGLWAGGGVCGAIFRQAGYDALTKACQKIGHCDTGKAVITPGFDLKAKYIIHAVGPIWSGGMHDEPRLLRSCYQEALKLVQENACHSIAFPLISSGVYGYPKELAWKEAIDACKEYIKDNEYDIDIIFAVLIPHIKELGESLLSEKE